MSKGSRLIFHVYVLLMLFGMTVAVLYFLLMRNDFLAQNPDIEPYFKQYIGAALLTMLGAIALLKNRRWGFWVMLAGYVAAFVLETMAGFPLENTIRIPAAALALFLLSRWNRII